MTPLLVGVAGGSGSGKSTVVRHLLAALGPERAVLVEQDAYYRDSSGLPLAERALRNYDHPDAIDEPLLVRDLSELKASRGADLPRYDFVGHARLAETRRVEPRPCVILEGILVLATASVRDLLDVKLYVETDADVRFIRRLRRDIAERGRTVESVVAQWEATVRPMYLEFVEPSKRHADIIIPEGGLNSVAMQLVTAHLRAAAAARGG
jgi:uridine kinase